MKAIVMKTERLTEYLSAGTDRVFLAEATDGSRGGGRLGRRSALVAGISLLIAPLLARSALASSIVLVNESQYDAFAVLGAYSEFGTFMGLVEQAGLAGEARSASNVTVFAPTNAAFYKYPTYYQTLIPGGSKSFPDTSKLIEFCRNHVVSGLYTPDKVAGKKLSLTSLTGAGVDVDGTGSGLPTVTYHLIGDQTVTAQCSEQPIQASNAVIYPINDAILTGL
jgi:uncharacterized surface protein with fasciclin (FAS1) repeats